MVHTRPFTFIILCLLISACSTMRSPSQTATEPPPPRVEDAAQAGDETDPADNLPGTESGNTGGAGDQAETDIWNRMRQGFGLPEETAPAIDQQLRWYAKNQDYLDRVFSRAEPYLVYILDEIESRGIPTEIALLPVVESAYDPFAYSHGRASGLWQFIPGTGKIYGLKQDWWIDGRRDVIASTEAALNHLEMLHRQFKGDWLLALAAYNSGGGKVSRAIRQNRKAGKPTDFWHLRLPKETRDYVPKLLALRTIVASPEEYGVTLHGIDDTPYLAIVEIGDQLDLIVAAELTGMSIEEIYRLNPGYNRWTTHPEGPHRLVVPVNYAEILAEKLEDLPDEQRIKWIRHQIKSGETLSHIAQRYSTSVPVLRQANRLRGNTIRAGHHLLVPVAMRSLDHYTLSAEARLAKLQDREQADNKTVHIVRRGDNFWDIARRYGVTVREITKWNGMAPGDLIRPGQKLVIWTEADEGFRKVSYQSGADPTVRTIKYTVRRGDSLSRISQRFKVSINDLREWNGLRKGKHIYPGQTLKVQVDVTSQSQSI